MINIEKDTRERIRQKADEMFMKYGVRSVSMDDIAVSMGISKKTIYQFFSDKDELVEAVVDVIVKENRTNCEHDRLESINAVDEIFKAMEMIENVFRNMNPSVLYDLQKYHPKAFARFQKHKHDYLFSIIKRNLEEGIAQELYRDDINIDLLSRFRVESLSLPFNPDFLNKQKNGFAEVQHHLLEHFLFGVASMKGYKLILKYQQERKKVKNETNGRPK